MSAGLYFPLLNRSRIRLTGSDRVRYLNGQCTNDVRKLTVGGPAVKACVLSARGKLDAVVWVWADADALILDVDAEVAEALAIRLERYIVADDVTLDSVSLLEPEWHWIPEDPSVVSEGLLTAPFPSRLVARFGDVGGIDVAGTGAERFLAELDGRRLNTDEVEMLRIRQGIPAWGSELGPETLPAEAGLDRSAVDFHKGCYLGQEVVSRIESVGHANRILRGFVLEAGAELLAGAVFDHPSLPGKTGAVVTSLVFDFDVSKTVGLCYTMRGIADGDRLVSGANEILIRNFPV